MTERILYLDLVGGVAGDMLLASLLDLGAPFDAVRAALDALGLEDVTVEQSEVHPAGLRARQVDVLVGGRLADSTTVEGTPTIRTEDEAWTSTQAHGQDHHHARGRGHRPWRVVRERLAASGLAPRVKGFAQDAFRRLAEAESLAHGIPLDEVEFHEVGSDDAIADIVGTAVAFDSLGVARVVASPFPLGRGLSRGAHGPLPVPGPATLHLLAGAPTVETSLTSETVTPTGAALVRMLASGFGPFPAMTIERVGVGAGHKRWPDRPNVVRAILGHVSPALPELEADALLIETNIDDMSPEHFEHLYERLYEAGALDVWTTSALFKKGRPGWVLSILAPVAEEAALSQVVFQNTPSLGVRVQPTQRRRMPRTMETIDTTFGPIRVKRSPRPDEPDRVKPEYEDVVRAARAAKVSLREVESAVAAALSVRAGVD